MFGSVQVQVQVQVHTVHTRCRLAIALASAGLLATALAGTPVASASTTGGTFIEVGNDPWGSSFSYNYFSPHFLTYTEDFVQQQLAVSNPTKGLASFVPQLATSWAVKGDTFVVNLRRGVLWQNGHEFTSTDVVDSVLLNEVNGGGSPAIKAVTAPSLYVVDFTLEPNITVANAEQDILGLYMLPSSEYGQFVTPGLAAEMEAFNALNLKNPTAAAKSPEGKAVSAIETKLLKYNPPTIIGTGPFAFRTANTAEMEMVKSPSFYDASDVRVGNMLWEMTSSAAPNAGAMLTGSANFSWTGFSWPIYQREEAAGVKIVTAPNWADWGLYFNEKKYPLNMVQVRQAIAYLVHRPDLQALADGGHTWYSFVKHPSLLYQANELQFVTKAQLDSLNSYPYDPAKAAQLLESVGFKKVSGRWVMPNGKPFTLSYGVPAGWNGPMGSAKIIPAWLSAFGISTTGSGVEQPGFWTYQYTGNYGLDWGWGGWGINPLARMAYVLNNLNYPYAGAYKGDPGLGFGPVMDVPGIGAHVDIPRVIQQEADTVPAGKTMDPIVWAWTKFINKELPVFLWEDKNIPFQFTSNVQLPPKSSDVYDIMGYTIPGGLAVGMEEGYFSVR